MFTAEKKVANFILKYPQKVVGCNVSELAKLSGVSDATVIRMCHHIDYTGYYQFRITLARDLGKKQYSNMGITENSDVVDNLFAYYAQEMISIGKKIDENIMKACVNLLKSCGHVHIMAVGNTAPLAQYMGFRLGRLGIKATYNVSAEYFLNHVNLAESDDVLIAISKSGSSKQIIQGMELGKEKGLKSIAITSYALSPVSQLADYVLLSTGTEETFNYYKDYAHLTETAVIDALLNFVTTEELIKNKGADKPEFILSDYKL